MHAIGGDESRGSSRVNKHVKDAIREDAPAAQAAGHESAISELYRLAQVAWHEPVLVMLLLIAAFTAISGRLANGVR